MKQKFTALLVVLVSVFSFAQKQVLKENQPRQITLNVNSKALNTNDALVLFSKQYKLNNDYTFKKISSNEDLNGIKHVKYQQYYKNIKVEFGTVILHIENDFVNSINGELYNSNDVVISPSLNNNVAFTKVLNHVNAKSYLWENAAEANMMNYKKPEGELVILPNINNGNVNLSYKYDIYATSPIARKEIYIDANTGEILFSNPIIKHADKLVSNKELKSAKEVFENNIVFATGTAATKYSGTRNIETSLFFGSYVLNDVTRGNGVVTYNSARTNTYPTTNFTDNDNNWTAAEHNNVNKDNVALDAHWGAEMTYDFWSVVFGRNSYDNNGAQIKSFVHYDDTPDTPAGYSNAFWNGAVMTYGDGSTKPLTAIDVCGHEIGHAICSYTADLVYQNESGAMNEGFSDIWGACIEHFGRTGSIAGTPVNNIWQIGEDLGGIRSMNNPNSYGDPDTYLGTNWYSGTADSGGVHTNSGVLNHWFYILSVGKSGTNNAPIPDTYNVTGITIAKAAEIAYLAERDYLTPNSTYVDARNATISVVNSLYCANSPEAIAVTNAWYAVNVGDQYSAVANDVALSSVTGVSSITCGTVANPVLKIKNQGTSPINTISISHSIDGGTLVNNTWNGSLLACADFNYPLNLGVLARGTHLLSVTTTIVNDGRSENNTKTILLLVNDAGTIGVTNPFTNSTDALISYNQGGTTSLWKRGVRPFGTMTSNSNTVYTTNLSGNYPDQTKSYLVSQCYNLTNVSNPEISFKMKYDLEPNFDIVYVEYSTNFGANWSVLGTMGTNWYNSNRTNASSGAADDCQNCPGAQWTGTSTTNTTYSYSLTSLGAPSNIIFRIVFHSDPGANQLGVNIDDFVINGTLSSQDFDLNNVSVYPNPSQGVFNVSLGNLQTNSIEVYDLMGKQIISKKNITSSEVTLDLTNASQGVYFVKISTNEQQVVKRIIKQ